MLAVLIPRVDLVGIAVDLLILVSVIAVYFDWPWPVNRKVKTFLAIFFSFWAIILGLGLGGATASPSFNGFWPAALAAAGLTYLWLHRRD